MPTLQPEFHENTSPLLTMTPNDIADPVIIIQPSVQDIPDSPSDTILLPIPTRLTDSPQSSFVLQEQSVETRRLPSELVNADIYMAPDRSFVETASGPIARELKKYWDQVLGVGKDVRSPCAITAFVNQHGKQMFRVGHRELSAPAANAAEIEERITSSSMLPNESSTSLRVKRRSRISMHSHLSSIFKNGSNSKPGTPQPSAPRKLRKTRSIPDLVSTANDGPAQAYSVTGRLHSRSVTGADVSPYSTVVRNPITVDLFGQLMDWYPPPSTSASISTNSLTSDEQSSNETHDHLKSPAVITHPFGYGVLYDSPSRKSTGDGDLLPVPRHLREVQSFESGLTARQADDLPIHRSGQESSLAMEIYLDEPDSNRPPSALRVLPTLSPPGPNEMTPTSNTSERTFQTDLSPESEPETNFMAHSAIEPGPEPVFLSRYSTEVFDVLQKYRGLPMLDKLSFESESTTVIKLSLSADEGAAPRDDPRFVIWGEVQSDRDFDEQSLEHSSVTDLSSVRSSSLSKRRASKIKAVESSTVVGETQKVLLAATIERWIAQLTSDLNYDELLDFFLTYRTYISSVDLLHLLIARFHWTLQQSTSLKNERVYRIVRVRTFVAIRYWLLTFFTVDFIPNRELRLLMANWLNSLVGDPILRKHVDGLGIVRKLIKVAKECKQAHTRLPARSSPKPRKSISPRPVENHVLGARFAAATRKHSEDDDSDVDLDFLPDEGATPIDAPQGFSHDIANAHLSVNAFVGINVSPTRPTSIPLSSLSILQRTDHAPGPVSTTTDLPVIAQAQLPPTHRSAVSRVITKTIGRLGRWRRTLVARTPPSPPGMTVVTACADVSAFDLELTGPPEYVVPLQTVDVPVPLSPEPPRVSTPHAIAKLAAQNTSEPIIEPAVLGRGVVESVTTQTLDGSTSSFKSEEQPKLPPGLSQASEVTDKIDSQSTVTARDDQVSVRSSTSTDSFGEPLTGPPTFPQLERPQWQFDVISIDDLSDTSSDFYEVQAGPRSPPGLRRPPKKLPMRRDFEFVRRDTVSSMGLTSRDSVTSTHSSHASTASAVGLGGTVAQWQLNALVDSLSDDEEKGDVEDALRRLEGQINPQKELEKASKVDGWVRSIQERLVAGDYSNEQSPFLDDSDEEEYVVSRIDDSSNQDSVSIHLDTTSAVDFATSSEGEAQEVVKTPIPTQLSHTIVSQSPTSPAHSTDARPAVEAAVPLEILQGRLPSRPSTSSSIRVEPQTPFVPTRERSKTRSVVLMYPASEVSPRESPNIRSFVLMYRAANLAEHFAMIDRELFMGVKFEELVLDDWINCQEVDVLDWTQYLKDRARWKVEHRYPEKTSALGAVRARFNLMANFTISEVVLASPNDRPMVVAKLIRIAWKSYRMCNFSTLVAIITGLGSDWVAKAMKRTGWSRLGIWETRMYRDLKAFAISADDFTHIRQAVASIVDAKPLEVNSKTASVISGGDNQPGKSKAGVERPTVPTACIPFIGVYLSQLQRHSRLPDLIDPTAPEEAVGINPVTSNFDAPAHPEVFSALTPLPASMHLEPLINVHKQRRIASVIKSLVAGQHFASRIQFDVDKKLFQKCLKVHAVNAETLQRILVSE